MELSYVHVSVYISVSYLCFRGSFTPKVHAASYYNNKRVRFIIVHTLQYHYTYMHTIIRHIYLLYTEISDVELTHSLVYNIPADTAKVCIIYIYIVAHFSCLLRLLNLPVKTIQYIHTTHVLYYIILYYAHTI